SSTDKQSTEVRLKPRRFLSLRYAGLVSGDLVGSRAMKQDAGRALLVADLAGTFLFGIEGAAAAIRGDLDLLGMMVLAFSTALAGGVVRDLLIGAVPPESIKNWRYAATAFTAAMLTFFFYRMVQAFPATLLMVLDAGGLALFAVAGTEKALEYKIHPFMAALLGTITGVGGGTIRDIFLAHVPRVLQSDIYATAALAGAVVLLVTRRIGAPPMAAAFAGGGCCFVLRVVAATWHWNLPWIAG
ncbi:MAG TPA: trimeric intracellular cation channel family protein, partial [Candidatus Acidoferrum sp.]|nr:trimeric intracellular cation channel family protein [Candidatus Acidoferrum sp.]